MTGSDYRHMTIAARFAKRRFRLIAAPAPGVAKPNRRQQMQRRRFGTAVSCIYSDEDVVGIRLRVLKLDVKVATFSERVRIPNLKLAFDLRAPVVRPTTAGGGRQQPPNAFSATPVAQAGSEWLS